MNNIRHIDLSIPDENPFEYCKLNRKQYAEPLTNLIKNYQKGFVLAINNEWGYGKTTFIKMWRQHLNQQKITTIYYNAWENDFQNDALVSILGELKSITTPNEDSFTDVVNCAKIFAKNILPTLVKDLVKLTTGSDIVTNLIENATKSSVEYFSNEIDSYTKKKEELITFKEKLATFIKNNNQSNLPIIFFIDELDRCRPNFAVEVLEKLKHFFSVEGIVFVLSIDKTQLGNAVRGVYGTNLINSDEYLRRFIDIEFTLPKPNDKIFVKYLCGYFNIYNFFNNEYRQQLFKSDYEAFLSISFLVFSSNNSSLRLQEKIFSQCAITLKMFPDYDKMLPIVFFILIYIKVTNIPLYNNICNNKIDKLILIQTLKDYLFGKNASIDDRKTYVIYCQILYCYFNNLEFSNAELEFENLEAQKLTPFVFCNEDSWSYCKDLIKNDSSKQLSINYFTKYIDLSTNFQ